MKNMGLAFHADVVENQLTLVGDELDLLSHTTLL